MFSSLREVVDSDLIASNKNFNTVREEVEAIGNKIHEMNQNITVCKTEIKFTGYLFLKIQKLKTFYKLDLVDS